MQPARRTARLTATGIATAALGIVLFVWFVRRVGAGEIWSGLRDVGWGLVVITAIAGLRFALRGLAWSLCLEPPHRLGIGRAFNAVIAGDAFGNLTPLGPIISEPTKAVFVRDRVPLAASLTALAVENLLYTLSVSGMIAASMIALLFSFTLPDDLRRASEISLAGIIVIFAAAVLILWLRPALVSRALSALLPGGSSLHSRLDRIRALEQDVYSFAARRRAVLVPLLVLQVIFHGLGVLEIHVTWWLMTGAAPPLLTSFILEGANRLITVVFKVVPFRIGIDEAGTAAFTQVLGYGVAPGATLAIVRKIRVLFWTTVGTTLLVRRGLTPNRVLDNATLDQRGQTGVRPGSDRGQTGVRPGSDRGLTPRL